MKGNRRWLGEIRGRPIFWAGTLGITVALALLLAIVDPDWRAGLKDFQIALGGLGALAAALAQHDGATAAVREARRKEDRDREELRRRLLIQCRLDAYNLYQICLARAKIWSSTPPTDNDEILKAFAVIPRSEAIESAWEHVALFPDEVAKALSNMLRHIMTITNTRVACTTYSDAPRDKRLVGENEANGLVETLKSTAQAAEQLTSAMARFAEETDKQAVRL
jgi:hypothetical protein